MPHTMPSLGTDTGLRPDLVLLMRPTVLGSPGRAPPENEPVVVKLEDSEEEGEGTLWDPGPEAARLRFRCFRYEEAIGPQEALAQLRELCHQWLRPEVHSKEQMLDLLVLEQFLGALPPEIQTRVQGQWPGSPEEAAALVDRLQWELDGPRKWVTVQVQGKEVLSEKMEPSSFQPIPHIKLQAPEPGAETPPGVMQELPVDLQMKEETEVMENPELLESGPPPAAQEATAALLPKEAQGHGTALDQTSPHSDTEPDVPPWSEDPVALWHEEVGGIFSPATREVNRTLPARIPARVWAQHWWRLAGMPQRAGAGAALAPGPERSEAAAATCVARCSASGAICCGTRRSTRASGRSCVASAAAASVAAPTCCATSSRILRNGLSCAATVARASCAARAWRSTGECTRASSRSDAQSAARAFGSAPTCCSTSASTATRRALRHPLCPSPESPSPRAPSRAASAVRASHDAPCCWNTKRCTLGTSPLDAWSAASASAAARCCCSTGACTAANGPSPVPSAARASGSAPTSPSTGASTPASGPSPVPSVAKPSASAPRSRSTCVCTRARSPSPAPSAASASASGSSSRATRGPTRARSPTTAVSAASASRRCLGSLSTSASTQVSGPLLAPSAAKASGSMPTSPSTGASTPASGPTRALSVAKPSASGPRSRSTCAPTGAKSPSPARTAAAASTRAPSSFSTSACTALSRSKHLTRL
ncbi:myeloid zinc finger 1 isoform X3 [Peromyscus californicus insignis]|uniref:myeloid zinc finger 1 isoform X3 n=1 Tax=Peromyscus californicus insignis TaxID=564181 RepID=UPI0022A7786A|nr:myeloid zinc finger 1 isoform X3 [Peromyscus californicus insignis]